ncbi:LysR family transcriptional regulator [Actinomadura algeriensis]|uniref:DNA-binding transcriptional LysR family regulator n=1 Tax=Actinomadura algeriensis TaxID=1679523 RepID=A0ABR9JPC9_9ACTN|nr:LysR family transcriptional regulator [Actinomadura algeriensis]MBE1532274.1 DNA-binding transcriptional LysR family regulator [Actinomadura algeriensis]
MLDLHRLRLLRELKHRGTLAAVAEALSYSPSSISQQLSVLEREAGVPLLEPVGRRVRLTPQAEILVAHTEAVLERLERAEADLAASLRGLTGTLRVAAFQTAALALVPDALSLLGEAHPGLRVEVTQCEPESALPALLARDFDVAVTEEYPDEPIPRPDGIEYAELGEDEMRLALPDGAASEATLATASGLPWVMEPAGTASRRWATRLCRNAGFEPDVRYESTDLLLHLRLVERGHAAALLPDLVWTGGAPAVRLVRLPRGRHVRRLFTATRRGSGAHPAVRAWCEALARPLRERPQDTLKEFADGG